LSATSPSRERGGEISRKKGGGDKENNLPLSGRRKFLSKEGKKKFGSFTKPGEKEVGKYLISSRGGTISKEERSARWEGEGEGPDSSPKKKRKGPVGHVRAKEKGYAFVLREEGKKKGPDKGPKKERCGTEKRERPVPVQKKRKREETHDAVLRSVGKGGTCLLSARRGEGTGALAFRAREGKETRVLPCRLRVEKRISFCRQEKGEEKEEGRRCCLSVKEREKRASTDQGRGVTFIFYV